MSLGKVVNTSGILHEMHCTNVEGCVNKTIKLPPPPLILILGTFVCAISRVFRLKRITLQFVQNRIRAQIVPAETVSLGFETLET